MRSVRRRKYPSSVRMHIALKRTSTVAFGFKKPCRMVRDLDLITRKAGILKDFDTSPLPHKAVILMDEFPIYRVRILERIRRARFRCKSPPSTIHSIQLSHSKPSQISPLQSSLLTMQFFKLTFLFSIIAAVAAQESCGVCCRLSAPVPRYAMLRPRDSLDCCMPQDGCTPCEGC